MAMVSFVSMQPHGRDKDGSAAIGPYAGAEKREDEE